MYRTFLFSPTLRCNLACEYCYQTPRSESWNYLKTFETLLKEIGKYYEPFTIILHGGEPTLIGKENLRKLCEIAKNSGIFSKPIGIQTNLYNWDDDFSQIAKDYDLRISTSYDGPVSVRKDKRGQDTSKLVRSKIQELQKNGFSISFIADLLPICPVEDVIDDFCELGVKTVQVRFPHTTLFEKNKMTQYVLDFYNKGLDKLTERGIFDRMLASLVGLLYLPPKVKKRTLCVMTPCMELRKYISVLGNGDIFPCNRLIDSKYKIGNVYKNTLVDAINSDTTKCIVKKEREIWQDSECKECPARNVCFGGCHGERTNNKYIACDLTKARLNLVTLLTQIKPNIIDFYIGRAANA